MVQVNHTREYKGKGSLLATMETDGAHNHLLVLPQQTPKIMKRNCNLHHQHRQNLILHGTNVCKQEFYRGRDDEIQDDTNQ